MQNWKTVHAKMTIPTSKNLKISRQALPKPTPNEEEHRAILAPKITAIVKRNLSCVLAAKLLAVLLTS